MEIVLWIVLGALAGWIASIIMRTDAQQGLGMDIIMGMIGAVVGGFLMGLFGQQGVTGFNLYSILVAVLGAVVVIYIGRMFRRTV
ncbi:MAG: GlsB/YeaQ/YmgE family stress response membrane protein [Candidatus Levybacteria bacterium]|nr:GlsB/YeaQ/YmgE family stress response membrane protein [Candidatus Levybacteria bacterium]